jgi:hypothetical protein
MNRFRKMNVVSVVRNFKFNSIFFRMLMIIFASLFTMCIINFLEYS